MKVTQLSVKCLRCHSECPLTCVVVRTEKIDGGLKHVVRVTNDSLAWLQVFVGSHEGPFRKPE